MGNSCIEFSKLSLNISKVISYLYYLTLSGYQIVNYILNFRYDNGSNRSRKHPNDQRSLQAAKKIQWAQKSNQSPQGMCIFHNFVAIK